MRGGTRVVADDLRVCSDCAQVIANGEISDGTDRGDRTAAAQVAVWGADAIGLVLAGTDDGPDPFSTAPCDGCGSTLAGERWDAAVIR